MLFSTNILRQTNYVAFRDRRYICIGEILIPNSEKIIKLDAKRRQYDIVVIGEEPHVAYNRVGLTSFFEHREVEQLYLNPKEWVSKSEYRQIFLIANRF